jgi:hypothetical protein
VDEAKSSESNEGSESESKIEKGRQIIDMEPSAIVARKANASFIHKYG